MGWLVFIAWVFLSLIVGSVAKSNKRSFGSYFCLSLIFSPIVGLLVLLAVGKATDEELLNTKLNDNDHIFYCPNCDKTLSGSSSTTDNCPVCNNPVVETVVLTSEWRGYTDQQKIQKKKEFASGKYLRYSNDPSAPNGSAADELKKFKELLDSGAITQEEYDLQKKKILNL